MGCACNLKPSFLIKKQSLNVNEYWQSVGAQISIILVWVPVAFHMYATKITVMEQYIGDCCAGGCVLWATK
jgi:hypothetical protein